MSKMDVDLEQPSTSNNDLSQSIDLVGGPFAVIESDPGVFTSLVQQLGAKRVEVTELYDIEPWAVDHLKPYGLIFCFTWHRDVHRPADFEDPAAERVWFANQLSSDACATHALLNVLFNCPGLDLGQELENFKLETTDMSSVMRGLAITNFPLLRRVHNALARPADKRAALNAIALETLEKAKSQATTKDKGKSSKRPPKNPKTRTPKETGETEMTYHFIGYVPAFGKVWELDGLKSGPLEVGELPSETSTSGWMDVARPALRMKMAKYGGSGTQGGNIQFSLLAVVEDMYCKALDDLEFLKKDKDSIEKRLSGDWKEQVDQTLIQTLDSTFEYEPPKEYQHPPGFANKRMERDIEIMEMPERHLISAWNDVMRKSMQAKLALEDESSKRIGMHTEHIKRTHDYEPFLREFVTRLHNEGLLYPLLDLDENGRKISPKKKRTA